MSFESQDAARKRTLFRQALRAYESSLGVWVQSVPSAYLARLVLARDARDPVYVAIRDLDRDFAGCAEKDVDMGGCVESLLLEHAQDKKGDGCALIAWAQDYPDAPRAVGILTLHNLIPSDNFKTTPTYMSKADYSTLAPYFGSRYVYIDCMCSTRQGVGRLLINSALKYAIAKKKLGVLALAFAARAKKAPESAAAFERCGFTPLIAKANYRVQMYGTWYVKRVADISLDGIDEQAFRVCTRTGLTSKTQKKLIWRC